MKNNARLIPHLLTDEQKRSRILKKKFNNLVTRDETWVYYFKLKRKCSDRVWATKNAVRPSVAKRQRTVKKVLYVIFFDNEGPVMQLPVPRAETSQKHSVKMLSWKSWRHTSRNTILKQDSSTCAFCMIMLPTIRHALWRSFLSLKRLKSSHIPLFHLTWLPVIISCFPNSNFICLEKDIS